MCVCVQSDIPLESMNLGISEHRGVEAGVGDFGWICCFGIKKYGCCMDRMPAAYGACSNDVYKTGLA